PAAPAASPAAAPARPPATVGPTAAANPLPATSAAGGGNPPAASGASQPDGAPRVTANAAEWERLKDAARREGKVVVLGPGIPAVWRGGALRVAPPSDSLPKDFYCCLQTAEWVMTDLFVNPQVVPPSAITSWKDLLRPEYRGKITASDVRSPGPGRTTAGYLWALFGEQYLRDLF